MKRLTVRDLRQRLPETEKALQRKAEIVLRARFEPVAHGAWQRRMSGGTVTRWVEEGLLAERDER